MSVGIPGRGRRAPAQFDAERARFLEHLASEHASVDARALQGSTTPHPPGRPLTFCCHVHGVLTRRLDTLWTRWLEGKQMCSSCYQTANPQSQQRRQELARRQAQTKLASSAVKVQARLDHRYGQGMLSLDVTSFAGYHHSALLTCQHHPEQGAFAWKVADVSLARFSPCPKCRDAAASKTAPFVGGSWGARRAGATGPWASRGDGGWLYEIVDTASPRRYVGITHNRLEVRLGQHIRSARGANDFRRALRERPQDFHIQPIAYYQHRWALAEAEREAILERGTIAPAGYNTTLGGSTLALDRLKGVRLRLRRLGLSATERARFYQAVRGDTSAAVDDPDILLARLEAGVTLDEALTAPVRRSQRTGRVCVLGVEYPSLRAACVAHSLDWKQTSKEAKRNGLDYGVSIEMRLDGRLREVDNRFGSKVRFEGVLYPSLYAAAQAAGISEAGVRQRAQARGISVQQAFDEFHADELKRREFSNVGSRNAQTLDRALSLHAQLTAQWGLQQSQSEFLAADRAFVLDLNCSQHGSFRVSFGVARKKARMMLPVCSVCSMLQTLSPAEQANCLVFQGVRWYTCADALRAAELPVELGCSELKRHKPSARQGIFDEMVRALTAEPAWCLPMSRNGREFSSALQLLQEAGASLHAAVQWAARGHSVAEAVELVLRHGGAAKPLVRNQCRRIEVDGTVYRGVRAFCDDTGVNRKRLQYHMGRGLDFRAALERVRGTAEATADW